ncbi:MAG: hypothetical protein IPO21_05760 [Bacteroidales bacterium]|nr:hypothetical protein [Bacteroidales bacterium]
MVRVDVKLYGDEFYMRAESLDGYTLVQDSISKWIYYAQCNQDCSELLSTGVIYSGSAIANNQAAASLNLLKHAKLNKQVISNIVEQAKIRLYGPDGVLKVEKPEPKPIPKGMQLAPQQGIVKQKVTGLVLIVDFSDEPLTSYSVDVFDSLWNGKNHESFGIDGSVRQYFLDVSGGAFEFNNIVYGVYRASKTFAEYDNLGMGEGAT